MNITNLISNICYRGDRRYLHSTDIYTEVTNIIKRTYGDECWITHIEFRGFLRRQVVLLPEHMFEKDITNYGKIKVKTNTSEILLTMTESDKHINCNYKDQTDYVQKKSDINESALSGSVIYHDSFEPIQLIVFLTKYMHTKLVSNLTKWVASQIDVLIPLEAINTSDTIEIFIINNVANKFTLSEFFINNNKYGSIRFMAL